MIKFINEISLYRLILLVNWLIEEIQMENIESLLKIFNLSNEDIANKIIEAAADKLCGHVLTNGDDYSAFINVSLDSIDETRHRIKRRIYSEIERKSSEIAIEKMNEIAEPIIKENIDNFFNDNEKVNKMIEINASNFLEKYQKDPESKTSFQRVELLVRKIFTDNYKEELENTFKDFIKNLTNIIDNKVSCEIETIKKKTLVINDL